MCGMKPLRKFKTNQCCHLIVAADTREEFGGARRSRAESRRPSRIANRTFCLKGLSVDDEKLQKARRRNVSRFEQDMPERVPHILEKGSNKVAYGILKQLADGPRRPAELRAALGISSVNFFTARYLTPLAKAGCIAAVDAENLHSPQRKYRLAAKGRKLVS